MLIKTKVFPESPKNEVKEKASDHFYIFTTEPRIQGRATQSAKELLARRLSVSENKLRLRKGFTSQNKLFELLE